MIKMLCERCGRLYGSFWGNMGLEESGIFVGVCFNCEDEERGETAGPLVVEIANEVY